MFRTLIKLGFVPLFVGAIVFLLSLGLFAVTVASGAITLGIPLGTALIELGIPIATAFAFVGGCLGALADSVLNITARLSRASHNYRRSELEDAVITGQINIQEALLRHYRIVFDETAQTSILPSILTNSSSGDSKGVWEVRKFLCEYVLPLVLDKFPPHDPTVESWIAHWDKLVLRLVGCYHRVLGRTSFLGKHILYKLNRHRLALRIAEEYIAEWGDAGSATGSRTNTQLLLNPGETTAAIPAEQFRREKDPIR